MDTLIRVKYRKVILKTGNYTMVVFLVQDNLSDPCNEHVIRPNTFSII